MLTKNNLELLGRRCMAEFGEKQGKTDRNREEIVFGGVFIYFSNSLLSIFRVKNRIKILKSYHQTSLFTSKILLGRLINQ